MGVNDFDAIAPFYDFLARLVFGKSLFSIQKSHLHVINDTDSVLILGGGTGSILSDLKSCEITFLEKSKKMISRAKQRNSSQAVEFVKIDFHLFESDRQYDVIICPFFLDCFDNEHLSKVILKCHSHLKVGGSLIVTDFEVGQTNMILLKIMHWFFRRFAGLQSRELQPIHQLVLAEGFDLVDEKFLHRNMLFSRLYRNL